MGPRSEVHSHEKRFTFFAVMVFTNEALDKEHHQDHRRPIWRPEKTPTREAATTAATEVKARCFFTSQHACE